MIAAGVDRTLEWIEGHAFAASACALRRECRSALGYGILEALRLRDMVHQLPLPRAVGTHAFARRAEHVGEVAPDFALVGDAREAACSGEDAEQRQLGQAHRGGAVIDHQDLVAGERELIAAAGDRAVDRGEGFLSLVAARVLDAVARFVGELAEIHLPRVGGLPEHVDVGARAEHALASAGDHQALHLGMFEADAVQRIRKLDVDAEIVGIELELVAGLQALVLVHIHRERRHRTVEREAPVAVALRMRVVGDEGRGGLSFENCGHGTLLNVLGRDRPARSRAPYALRARP